MSSSISRSESVALHWPGTERYMRATSPDNSSGAQRPAAVAAPTDADQVVAAVVLAAERGWIIAPQATGHGAAGDIDDGMLLLDTSELNAVSIDPASKTATTGAGATWSAVNTATEQHGLLGRTGTSPSVGVAGYTFGGGVGWLARPHGLASAHLQWVEFVDGEGEPRRAAADATNAGDRDAWWAFRGGGGVGIATCLAFRLVPVAQLWAGHFLWPAADLEAVVSAWAGAIDDFGPSVTSSISLLHAPPAPPIPTALQGTPVVHLSLTCTDSHEDATALFDALARVAAPTINTWGPSDVVRLGGIHLDPPPGIPALGSGRWLTAETAAIAVDLLREALVGGSLFKMIELRHVANPDPPANGALTEVAGPFLAHAVGASGDPTEREMLHHALKALWKSATAVDTGRSAAPFGGGQRSPGTALNTSEVGRLSTIRSAVDPRGRIRQARLLPAPQTSDPQESTT